MKNRIIQLIIGFFIVATTSCEKCEIPVYDSISRVNFYEKVIAEALASRGMEKKVTFVANAENEMQVSFKACIMGYVDLENDRQIELTVVDSLTNAPSDHFRINPVILEKGKDLTNVVVTIIGTPDLLDREEYFRLTLTLKEANGFYNGIASRQVFSIYWNGIMLKPTWWTIYNRPNNSQFFGDYSRIKHNYCLSVLDLSPQEFEELGTDNRNYQMYMASICKEALDKYNAEHRDNPIMDENNQPMKFGDI